MAKKTSKRPKRGAQASPEVNHSTSGRRPVARVAVILVALFAAASAWYALRSPVDHDAPVAAHDAAKLAAAGARFVGTLVCAECHRGEYDRWKTSHHAHAMAAANAETVLGDFRNQSFRYNGVTSSFSQREGKYFVRTDGPDGTLAEYEVKYTFGYTPLQPPTSLLPGLSVPTSGFNCVDIAQQRVLSNQMIESMDAEIGRVLVETGLATRRRDGTLRYDPEETDTMIVLLGDNGTYFPGVKAPFDFERAKGTVYQTGVWVPLIVSGPLVRRPDRDVEHMVNVADLYELFGEIAGVDVHKVVPKSRPIDSAPMLPYLVNPRQESVRKTNFTQAFDNIKATGTVISPCVLEQLNVCVQLFPQQQLCAAENGTWYGPNGVAGTTGLTSCCAVNKFLLENNKPAAKILATSQMAIRNDAYRLVMTETPAYNPQNDQCEVVGATEFYRINEAAPIPLLDNENRNLIGPDKPPLNGRQRAEFAELSKELKKLLATSRPCPGDGNGDGKVDEQDRIEWARWSAVNEGRSSWYDFNFDGVTDTRDLQIINEHFGQKCR